MRLLQSFVFTQIGHVRYISFLTCSEALGIILSLNSRKRLDTKKTVPNMDVCPESLGAMLEY